MANNVSAKSKHRSLSPSKTFPIDYFSATVKPLVNAPYAMLKKTHPQQITPVRLQGGVRLQGQGVGNSINSVFSERRCGRKKHTFFVFGQMPQKAL